MTKIGHSSTCSLTLGEGQKEAFARRYDLVMLDVQLPDGNGLKSIEEIRQSPGNPDVIIITGIGDPIGAELAIRLGAWDYIEKPASLNDLKTPIEKVLKARKRYCETVPKVLFNRDRIIGKSKAISHCIELLGQAANSDVNVVLTGETGTGKELFTRILHENSKRAKGPFVVLDCGALPESLVQSMLFGHEKGSFTGADNSHVGLIDQADQGTLFLDEVAELPLSLQKAFLRVLQEKRFRPIGGNKEETSDFRVIAATNRNLEEMVDSGWFRKDLLYRLRSFEIELPPLRKRPEDVMEIVTKTVQKSCNQSRIPIKGFSPDFCDVLKTYDWPGNVRELIGTIQRALAAASNEPVLYPSHLPVSLRARAKRLSMIRIHPGALQPCQGSNVAVPVLENTLPYKDFRRKVLDVTEKNYFTSIAQRANGSSTEACRLTGLSRSRLFHCLQQYGISLVTGQTRRPKQLEIARDTVNTTLPS